MIEAFRDNGLNTLDHNAEINVSRLETILSSIYYQLNKRLPTTHQINVEQSIGLLLNFMVATYDRWVRGGKAGGVFDLKSVIDKCNQSRRRWESPAYQFDFSNPSEKSDTSFKTTMTWPSRITDCQFQFLFQMFVTAYRPYM